MEIPHLKYLHMKYQDIAAIIIIIIICTFIVLFQDQICQSLSHTFPPFSHIAMHPAIYRQILPCHTFT